MKKRLIIICLLLCGLVGVMAVSACADKPAEVSLTLSESTVTLERFSQRLITVNVTGTDERITYATGDENIALVGEYEGKLLITAKGEGDVAITASAGGKTASIEVFVTENKGYPVLEAADEFVTLMMGDSFEINAQVKYQGAAIINNVISLISDNASVLTAGKTLTGVSVGTATVTVSSEYCGELLTRDVAVTVRENATFGLNAVSKTLYTVDPVNNGEYETSFRLATLATKDSAVVPADGVTFTSSDPGVAVVAADGTVTSAGKGVATITAVWNSGSAEYTAACTVDVLRPVVGAEAEAIDFDVSLNRQESIDLSAVSYFESINAYEVSLDGEPVIGSFSNNIFTFAPGSIDIGEKELIFTNGIIDYRVPVVVATMIVSSKAEFLKIKTDYFTGLLENPPTPSKNRDGYFILDADIDFGNEEFKMYGLGGDTLGRIDKHGWFGTIDGRGHIVSRMVFGLNGLTDVMGWDTVIKNIGFVDSSFSSGIQSGIFGEFAYGTVDNCFFQFNDLKGRGALGTNLNGVTFTNSIVYISDFIPSTAINQSAIADSVGKSAILNNVFAVTEANVPFIRSVGLVTGNYGKYTSFQELRGSIGSVAAFNDDIWTKTDGTLIFTRYNTYLQSKFDSQSALIGTSFFEGVATQLPVSDINVSASDNERLDSSLLTQGVIKPMGIGEGSSQQVTLTITSKLNPAVSTVKTVSLRNILTVSLNNDDVDLSTLSGDYTYQIKENGAAISQEVQELSWNGVVVSPSATDSNGNITFSHSFVSDKLGDNSIIIITDTRRYTLNLTIASLIISDSADFMKIKTEYYQGDYNKPVSSMRDGYFILDSDINLNGADFTLLGGLQLKTSAGADTDVNNQAVIDYYGWSGVIDGRGFGVYNYTTGLAGMFGFISEHGAVKNISLSCNAITGNHGGVIANFMKGKIDNTLVELKAMPNFSVIGLFAKYLHSSGSISNSLGVLLNEDTTGHTQHSAIVQMSSGSAAALNNVFSLVKGTIQAMGSGYVVSGNYGVYNTMATLIAAQSGNLGGFDTRYWSKTDTTVSFIKMYANISNKLTQLSEDLTASYYQGDADVTLNTEAYKYTLTGDTAYIDADKLSAGKLSVTGLAEGETKSVTLKIESIYDSALSENAVLTLKRIASVDLEGGDRIDIDSSSYDNISNKYSYTFSAIGSDIIESVKLANTDYTSAGAVGGNQITVTLTQEQLRAHLGEQLLTVKTSEASYTLKVTIASLIVSTKADFARIQSEFYKGGYGIATSLLRDGYFVLDNDIDYENGMFFIFEGKVEDKANNRWSLTQGNYDEWHGDAFETYGWSGIIDGRGHKVYNLKTGYGGMFGHTSKFSVIKNLGVVCIEITNPVSGVLSSAHLGKIDNCYIELAKMPDYQQIGVIVRQVRNYGVISNSISVLTAEDNTSQKATHGAIIMTGHDTRYSYLYNVYSVKPVSSLDIALTLPENTSAYGSFDSYQDIISSVSGDKTGISGGGKNDASFSGFDSRYWTIGADSITFGVEQDD